jgi:phage tail-like protein
MDGSTARSLGVVADVAGLDARSPAAATRVVLSRGMMAPADLRRWMRNAPLAGRASSATVTIEMLADDGASAVRSWTLSGALPIKYVGPDLNGKATDVAVEELTLSVESIETA